MQFDPFFWDFFHFVCLWFLLHCNASFALLVLGGLDAGHARLWWPESVAGLGLAWGNGAGGPCWREAGRIWQAGAVTRTRPKKSVFWCMGVSWHHVRGRPTVGARVLEPAGNTSVHIPIDSSVLNSVTQRVDEIFISKRISNGGLVNGLIE